jgi:phosphatidylserine/phosphatidylglycerophosphate/cardiolipin synthase-like enzyme
MPISQRSRPLFRHVILLSSVLAFTISACQNPTTEFLTSRATGFSPTSQTQEAPQGWYSVYFSNPSGSDSQDLRGGPDRYLAEAIRNARASVDVAVLQLNLWSVRDALIAAHRQGVRVRVVTDSDYLDYDEIRQLIEAGIPVLGDRREGLMHNKFTVIDRLEVWTGSMNYTISEGYRNNNNLIRLRSPELAQNYSAEFEEMFNDDQFGPGSPANTPHPSLVVGDSRIDTCFSPDDGCTARLLEAIETAQDQIVFLAYSFTSDELAEALIQRAGEGVSVAGVMESSQVTSNRGSDYELFRAAGLDVRLDSNPKQMHEKVIIIDNRVAALGSFNYTFSAETRNDENLLIISDPQIAAFYLAEFERIFNLSVKGE